MRDELLRQALQTESNANILLNWVSRRVKQLRRGAKPLIESLERLELEDVALREIIEGKIAYRLPLVERSECGFNFANHSY